MSTVKDGYWTYHAAGNLVRAKYRVVPEGRGQSLTFNRTPLNGAFTPNVRFTLKSVWRAPRGTFHTSTAARFGEFDVSRASNASNMSEK